MGGGARADADVPALWREELAPERGCRMRVETKLSLRAADVPGGAGSGIAGFTNLLDLLRSSRVVASFSVLAFTGTSDAAAGSSAAERALERGLTVVGMSCVQCFSETLEELRLAETVPVVGVRAALLGGEARRRRRLAWPRLRKIVLCGSPLPGGEEEEEEEEGADGRPFFASRVNDFRGEEAEGEGEGEEEEEEEGEEVLFPSLETLAVKEQHAEGWRRRLRGVFDFSKVAVELRSGTGRGGGLSKSFFSRRRNASKKSDTPSTAFF